MRRCDTCLRVKHNNHRHYGEMQPIPPPDGRWERIHIDLITKLPRTSAGNDAVIIIIDPLTKRTHWIACEEKDLTSLKLANIVLTELICFHGWPLEVITDRDPKFVSEAWAHIAKRVGTLLKFTTAFHPQTDGQAKKANTIIQTFLRILAIPNQDTGRVEWDQELAIAEFIYNTTRQAAIGMSPFEADLGY